MKGFFVSFNGKIYKGTKPKTLEVLRRIAAEEAVAEKIEEEGFTEVGPVSFDYGAIGTTEARELFADISIGKRKEA